MSIADAIAESIDAIREVIQSARAVPHLINLPEKPLSVVVNAAFIAAVLVVANRALLHAETILDLPNFAISVALAAGSLVVVFLISAFIYLARTDGTAQGVADRWSVIFVFVWLVSLILFLIDQLLGSPVGWAVGYIAAGTTYGLDNGMMARSIFYAIAAYGILAVRTHRAERHRFSRSKALLAFFVIVPCCAVMLFASVELFREYHPKDAHNAKRDACGSQDLTQASPARPFWPVPGGAELLARQTETASQSCTRL